MPLNLRDARIGYVPLSPDLTEPGDCRRFAYYAKKRALPFEIARPSEHYDVVVLTQRADISVWSGYGKGRSKIIYDLTDSYLAISRRDPKGLLRGLAKYAAGQNRFLRLDHWKALEDMCRRSDAVACSTEEQRSSILPFCPNVHVLLDIMEGVASRVKKDYAAGPVFNLVWEGFPENIASFEEIRGVLEEIDRKRPIALHLVTKLEFGRFMGKYFKRRTSELARKIFKRTYLYEWNESLASTIISACDLAVIPIQMKNPLSSGKPENKLLLFWRMGLPAVVSATAAYSRAMAAAGLPMACKTPEQWKETLEKFILDDGSARRDAGAKGKAFAESNYGEEKLLRLWDKLFESLS